MRKLRELHFSQSVPDFISSHPGHACRSSRLVFLPFWEYYACVRVIAKRNLKAFWGRPGCGGARAALESWHEEALRDNWTSPHAVKSCFATASIVGKNRVVFNIGGNKYRLVVEMQYRAGIAWIKFAGTHAEYDRINVESAYDH
jgi:mRNA interferase HigB